MPTFSEFVGRPRHLSSWLFVLQNSISSYTRQVILTVISNYTGTLTKKMLVRGLARILEEDR